MIPVLAAVIVLLIIGSTFFLRARKSKLPQLPKTPEKSVAEPVSAGTSPDVVSDSLEEGQAEPADLVRGTIKSRSVFSNIIGKIRKSSSLDQQLWDELEDTLLLSDLGLALTERVIEGAKAAVAKSQKTDGAAIIDAIREQLRLLFVDAERELIYSEVTPTVWLIVGVNGVGKTTSIGKLSSLAAADGKKVILAAGDTFRAAAADQLQGWAERTSSDIVRSVPGADPSSVVFDAIQKAASRNYDLVIADTAGRLHTKFNLMEELKKLRRIADKEPGHLCEVLLVLDATTGQNGLIQAREFTQAANLTGVILTKLDGSAKGGIALAVEAELGVPIKLVGVGEQARDLIPFDPEEFISLLLDVDQDGVAGKLAGDN